MKRNFTRILAAFALLVGLAIPVGVWAAEGDVHDMNITQSTLLNNNAAIPSINIAAQSYSVNKVTINWRYNKDIENPVTIEVLVGENSWGTQTITGNTTADAVFEGESTIGAIVINFTNNTGSGTGHGTFYVNSVKLTEGESSGPAPTTYTVTFAAGDGTFVGNTDFPNASNTVVAGTYTLPSATPATGYTFDGWAVGETTYQAGASYTVSGDADFVASYTENTTPTPGGADVLNWVATGSPTNYTDWTYTAPSGAVYKGQSSGSATGQYIQLRSNNNNSGIVTTTSAGKVTNISVTWNSSTTSGRTLNVYGKNSAYSAATDLYGNNAGTLIGTIVYGTSTELIITDDYEYIGMRSASGAMYLDEIQITWESVTPALVATPTFNPESGTEFGDEGLNVTITCETNDASIYYTLNGDTPDNQSTLYNGEISLTETTTIKAIAYDGTNYSNVAAATYTYVDPNAPGTETNPYTVAQARAAIDANAGTQGVYATGIVSEIVTEWSTQYNNITFNFIDEEGNEDFLQAYRCASGTGVDASQVAVGDVVVVYGNLTKYDQTYEFGQGCQLVSLTSSGIPSITADNVNIAADATSGSIAYTINNPATNGTMAAETASDWLTLGVGFDSPIAFTCTANTATSPRTATVTLTYTYNTNQTVIKEVTINQEAYVAPTYAELPFAFNDGKDDIDGTDGLSQEGLGSDYGTENAKLRFDDTGDWLLLQFNERPGTLTFDIKGNNFSGGTFKVQTSEDGTNYTDLATYTSDNLTSTVNSEEFTDLGENVRYIKWIYTNKVSGNVGLGNITLGEYVAPQPSITVETNVIDVDAESHQEFLNVNFVNFEPTTGYAFTCDANGTFTDYSWLVAELDINNNRVRYTIGNNEEVARTGYFRVKCGDVYSEIVTVNQAAYVPPFEPATYIPATEINPDKRYIIVGFIGDDAYAMGYQKTNNRHAVGISFDGTTATVETSEVYELVIANQGDYYTIYDERTPGFLYAASDEKNWLRTEEELDDDGNGLWNITFGEQGLVDLVAANTNVRNVMQFNAGSSTTDPLFACYASANQEPVYLYEKVESAEYTLEITGYTDDSEKTGYHLIASPVFVDPYLVGMADGDFDLYSFDQSEEEEWRNYEAGSFTMLEPGKGYLYAKKATDNVQTYYFNLSGTPYVGDGYIDLAYDANEGVSFPGLNLIGNPFGEEATLNIPYYRMNSTGSGLEAVNETESPVNVMEGVFVYAEYNAEYGYVTNYAQFTPNGNTSGGGGMKINLTRNRGTAIDNAIVRFDEGQQLPKFQLFENSTKLYIPQGNEDYAIVRSAAQGEMPVSFRASENGTYTIAVEAENVDMNYLHLIDNMTGADVDLLATPNYTFEARTNDYTSRFRLVFSANGIDEQTAETFAFFNGTSWTVSNTGDATLQVVDITGRIVSSETINGNATISLNQSAGIYMLRLVNGNDVKVQKVVVR